jgi:hypothetical protein
MRLKSHHSNCAECGNMPHGNQQSALVAVRLPKAAINIERQESYVSSDCCQQCNKGTRKPLNMHVSVTQMRVLSQAGAC